MSDVLVVLCVGAAMRKHADTNRMPDHVHVEDVLDVAQPANNLRVTETETDANAGGGIALRKCSQDQKVRNG